MPGASTPARWKGRRRETYDGSPAAAEPAPFRALRTRTLGGAAGRRPSFGLRSPASCEPTLAPRVDLDVDVARHGHQRRPVDRCVARPHHAGVELLELAAYLRLGGVPVEPRVQLRIVLAQLQGRGQ